ncbi:uncharacterized protein MELLADRAFT_87613 [Melampsora larici-populina 98AG31]|uniref:Uncharacterized protein n=1 Tax=Melampsora larici-populina (strain 98AG31 / pathotype 3-4-7) TaxID=747676 RepID=F4RP24_MELLP|nr:uncharacterized protein MELLADRAFT_87613 [Melampsora larici-populina 98AG31]EGG05928.1 hypothetical protein MELLADRAFT_87613 [Melampsora larici-populina 98AG31]
MPNPSDRTTRNLAAYKRMQKIRDLYSSIIMDPLCTIPEELERMVEKVEVNSRIFTDDLYLQQSIITALDYLQESYMKLYERVWTLSVLDTLQSLLPRGNLNPIREDPNTGSVSRGGLELFLLKGLGIDFTPRVNGVLNARTEMFPVDEAVTEVLERVEVIEDLGFFLRWTGIDSPILISIHDQLLQNMSLAKPGIADSLISHLLRFKIVEETTPGEIKRIYQIMQHLHSFYPVTRQLAITEALERVKLIMDIRFGLINYALYPEMEMKIEEVYKKFIKVESLDDANILKLLTLQCLEHISLKAIANKSYPDSQELAITKGLKRVEWILKIRTYLKDAELHEQKTQITEFYKKSLPTSSLDKTSNVELTLECIQHIALNIPGDQAVRYVYSILGYLEEFYESSRQLIESSLSTNKPFRAIDLWVKSQSELQPHLQAYFKKEDKDPYIMHLLLPFESLHMVDVSYVKQCLLKLNVRDSVLTSGKGELYGLDFKNVEKYHEDQDFFIGMMYKLSPYIEGLEEYLKMHVWKNEVIPSWYHGSSMHQSIHLDTFVADSGHYGFLSSLLLSDEDEDFKGNLIGDKNYEQCAICKAGFLKWQSLVKLECGKVPHMFHEDCLNLDCDIWWQEVQLSHMYEADQSTAYPRSAPVLEATQSSS